MPFELSNEQIDEYRSDLVHQRFTHLRTVEPPTKLSDDRKLRDRAEHWADRKLKATMNARAWSDYRYWRSQDGSALSRWMRRPEHKQPQDDGKRPRASRSPVVRDADDQMIVRILGDAWAVRDAEYADNRQMMEMRLESEPYGE